MAQPHGDRFGPKLIQHFPMVLQSLPVLITSGDLLQAVVSEWSPMGWSALLLGRQLVRPMALAHADPSQLSSWKPWLKTRASW